MELTKKLIEIVKCFPALYDPAHKDYKNNKLRDKIWDEISIKLGERDGESLKFKWKNLRGSYVKYLRSQKTTTDQAYKRYKSWTWAKQMEFLHPFLKLKKTYVLLKNCAFPQPSNITDFTVCFASKAKKEEITEDGISNTSTPIQIQEYPPKKKIRKSGPENGSSPSAVDKVISNEQNTSINCAKDEKFDGIEYMFLGFAKTIKTFSAKRQAHVKFQIAEIVLKEELEQREEDESLSEDSFYLTPSAIKVEHETGD